MGKKHNQDCHKADNVTEYSVEDLSGNEYVIKWLKLLKVKQQDQFHQYIDIEVFSDRLKYKKKIKGTGDN